MKKRILYFMPVDWDWIKQRPHFLAEHLAKTHQVFIVFPFYKKRGMLTKNSRKGLKMMPFLHFPFRVYFGGVYEINKYLMKIFFWFIIHAFRPQVIWISSAEFIDYLGKQSRKKIVYDCMDDISQMNYPVDFRNRLLKCEQRLIRESYAIFVSSDNLLNKLDQRKQCREKAKVLRNAFEGPILNLPKSETKKDEKNLTEVIKIGYFGTISSWFDLEVICASLLHVKNLEYHIIGPCEIDSKMLSHPRIKLYGAIPHETLFSVVEEFDAFIMPFKICDLVESVDPVKLYEYINFGKPIISVFYAGISFFHPFVVWYSSEEDLLVALDLLIRSGCKPKYDLAERENFLRGNTWLQRAEEISMVLNSIE